MTWFARRKEKQITTEFQTKSSSVVAVVLVAMVSTLIWPVVTQSKSLSGSRMSIPSLESKTNSLVDDHDRDDRGRIAFVSFRAGNNDIFVMRPDGTHLVNVTNNPANDRLPAWSPDGSKIAFRSTRDGNSEIYVMNDDGSDVVRLTFDPAVDTTPSWTPEGRVLFSSNRSGRFEVYEVKANGTHLQHIDIAVHGDLTFPSQSPGGNRLAFTVTNFEAVAIWISNADGSHPTQLTPDELFAAFPDWSPVGNRIIFSNNVCPVCDLSEVLVSNRAGNHILQLTPSGDENNDLFPRWSPDGSQFVFSRDDFVNPTQIYIMNSDGSDVVNVTRDTFFDFEADWGPGKHRDRDDDEDTPARER